MLLEEVRNTPEQIKLVVLHPEDENLNTSLDQHPRMISHKFDRFSSDLEPEYNNGTYIYISMVNLATTLTAYRTKIMISAIVWFSASIVLSIQLPIYVDVEPSDFRVNPIDISPDCFISCIPTRT
jgi:hypothetical protein